MSFSRQFAFISLLGLAAIILLGQVPFIDQGIKHKRQETAVFDPVRVEALSDDNLVDALIGLPLRERLRRVSWDHSILTIDLKETDSSQVWTDTRDLILFSFHETDNVRQLLLRVFGGKDGNPALLMAAETKFFDWTPKELSRLKAAAGFHDSAITGKIRIAITPAGRRWQQNFAN
ncbi:hypothetical protein [Cohnella kolymensis]|uniref:hypothetical protein n=1 Tax=Cohnella kolymensis TaxID=1590652 RepID=UPI000696CFF6|nr:hypothetical protein [Cohnella kolymensis]